MPDQEKVKKVASQVLGTQKGDMHLLETDQALAKRCGIKSSKNAKKNALVVTQIAVQLDKYSRNKFETEIGDDPGVECIHYLEYEAYDATPVPMTITGTYEDDPDGKALEKLFAELGGGASVPSLFQCCLKESGPAKLLQIHSAYAMLLRKEVAGGRKKLFIVKGDALSTFKPMFGETAEHMLGTLRSNWSLTLQYRRYNQQTRAVTIDGGRANGKTERGVMSMDRAGWNHCLVGCHAHLAAGVLRKTQSFVKETPSGMQRVALSVKMAGQMSSFRKFFRKFVKANIILLEGQASHDAQLFRERAMKMFCSSGSNLIAKLVSLKKFPCGDWRNLGGIEVMVDILPTCALERQRIIDFSAEAIVFVFTARKFSNFKQIHWTGVDTLTDMIGSMELCHNLFSRTFPAWCEAQGTRPTRAVRGAPGLRDTPDASAAPAAEMGGSESCGAIVAVGASEEDPVTDDIQRAREMNARDREFAFQYSASKPQADLVLFRMVLEITQPLLKGFNELDGAEWEMFQQHEEAKRLASDDPADRQHPPRFYAMTVAAEGILEAKSLRKVKYLMETEAIWALIPETAYTEQYNAKVFQTMSRLGALIEKEFAELHRKPPYRLFLRISKGEGVAQELDDIDDCLLGKFGRTLKATCGGTFAGDMAFYILLLIATTVWITVTKIEARNARIQRAARARSNMTHVTSVMRVQSDFTAMAVRNSADRHLLEDASLPSICGDEEPAPTEKKRQRRGGGGTCRAYLHENLAVKSMAECHADYKTLDDEAKEELRKKGALGTKVYKLGGESSFGVSKRELARNMKVRERDQRLEMLRRSVLGVSSESNGHEHAISDTVALVTNTGNALQLALQHQRDYYTLNAQILKLREAEVVVVW